MREGQYRVWSVEKQDWMDTANLLMDPSGQLYLFSWHSVLEALSPIMYITQHFTGFVDKNNNLIFEGDILISADKQICGFVGWVGGRYSICSIWPNAPSIYLGGGAATGRFGWEYVTNVTDEIIGNIFNNFDLLSNPKSKFFDINL